ncbi:MAG: hypothetical protein PHN88_09525 [Ignavibacteria bacterium]|nr:hypothetical protein [Ignavibacteria bacterium]
MKLRLSILFAFIFLLQVCGFSQIRGGFRPRLPQFDRGTYYVDPLVFYDIDSLKPRLDAFVELPKDNLLYTKKSGTYTNSYEISLTLKDSKENVVFVKKYNETTTYTESDFKAEHKKSVFYLHNYCLNPGNYKLETVLKDITAGKEYPKTNEITVKDFTNRTVTFSDIMLLAEFSTTSEGQKEITPLISNNIFGHPKFHIFFEAYNNTAAAAYGVYVYKVTDHNDDVIKQGVLNYALYDKKTGMFENIIIGNPFGEMFSPEDPDIKEISKKEFGQCKITITDKSTGEIMTEKKIFFIPGKLPFTKHPEMGDR